MHKELIELLPRSTGVSESVVALFFDVRAFTSFSLAGDTPETAIYLRNMYCAVIEKYPEAAFVKPTGDGLMFIYGIRDEDALSFLMKDLLSLSLELVYAFPTILPPHALINTPYPKDVGIGMAAGSATRLQADDKTLDYTGRPLNLAARLMDLARPTGVVVDGGLRSYLDSHMGTFSRQEVYIRGISPRTPHEIFIQEDMVVLQPEALKPIGDFKWITVEKTFSFREFCHLGHFVYPLPQPAVFPENIAITIASPAVNHKGERKEGFYARFRGKAVYEEFGGKPGAAFDFAPLISRLSKDGLQDHWEIRVTYVYQVERRPPRRRTSTRARESSKDRQ